MILFLNIFITDRALNVYDRGLLGPPSNRLDVFMYTLASYAVIPFEHAVIYCELDEPYKPRWNEFERFVYSLFPKAKLYPHRSDRQPQWQAAVQELLKLSCDGLVWFFANDDHVFVDYELELVNRIQGRLLDLQKEHEFVSCSHSHWAETWPYVKPGYLSLAETRPWDKAPLEITGSYFIKKWSAYAACQIVNLKLLHHWWFTHDYGDTWMPRTDAPGVDLYSPETIASIVPFRELVRHFDSSSHMNISIDAYPPLFIPPGFFENDIKIQFCGKERRPGFVYVNPLLEHQSTVSEQGADMRCVLEDLPVFWRSRISQVQVDEEIDRTLLLRKRNEAVLQTASVVAPMNLKEIVGYIGTAALRTEGREGAVPDAVYPPERVTYPSFFKENRGGDPLISIIVFDCHGRELASNSVRTLSNQSCARSSYEVVFVTVSEIVEREVREYSDAVIRSNQYDWRDLESYHKYEAYNHALKQARGSVLVFTDSMTLFPENFVSTVEATFYGGSLTPGKVLSTYRELPLQFGGGTPEPRPSRGTIAVRREDLRALGRLSESKRFLGESVELADLEARFLGAGVVKAADDGTVLLRRQMDNVDTLFNSFVAIGKSAPLPSPISPLAIPESQVPVNRMSRLLGKVGKQGIEGDWTGALRLAREFFTGNSELEQRLLQMLAAAENKDWIGSLEAAKLILDHGTEEPELLNLLGAILMELGNLESAEAVLLRAVGLDLASVNSYSALGRLYASQGKHKDSFMLFLDALRLSPRSECCLKMLDKAAMRIR